MESRMGKKNDEDGAFNGAKTLLGIGIATGFSLILGRCVYDQHQAFPDVTIAQKKRFSPHVPILMVH